MRVIQTGSFTATVNGRYTVSGTATVTDPTGTQTGQLYSVVIGIGSSAVIGGVTYSQSRVEVLRYYTGSQWQTPTPQFADSATLSGTNNTAPNQVLTGSSSLLTQATGDARYAGQGAAGTIYENRITTDSAYVTGTAYQNSSLSLTLAAGTYELEVMMATKGVDYAAGGAKLALPIPGGTFSYISGMSIGGTQAATSVGANGGVTPSLNAGNYPAYNSFAQAQDISLSANQNTCVRFDGLLTLNGTTTLVVQVAQKTSAGAGVCVIAGSYIRARKK